MLTVFASELAACIGMNKYQNLTEAMKKFWSRNNKLVYNAALERNAIVEKTVKQELFDRDIINDVQSIIESDTQFKNSAEIESTIKKLFVEKQQTLEPELAKQIKSYIHTEKGTNNEEASLDNFEKKISTKIVNRNSKFYKKSFQLKNGQFVQIGGKIDGLGEDGSLIEMKNRQYRFFNQVPVYEKIQIHAYMKILDKNECSLVQNFKGKSRYDIVQFDESFWDTIITNLSKFIKFYNKIISDSKLQDLILDGKEYQLWDLSDDESEDEGESDVSDSENVIEN